MKKVLLVSRPITKKFDEGSKNLVKNIITENNIHEITFLSQKSSEYKNSLKIFSDTLPFVLNRFLLIKILKHLKKFDTIHFFFNPSIFNLIFVILCRQFTNAKLIHSIPTANKIILRNRLFKKLLICDLYLVQSNFSKSVLENINKDLNIYNVKPVIGNYQPIQSRKKENKITYPGDYRLNSLFELFTLSKLFSKQEKYKLIFAFRVSSLSQKVLDLLFKLALKIMFIKNVYVFNSVPDIEKLYLESSCIIFPASKMINKIDIPHSVIEPLLLKTPILISNIQPLNEINKNFLFDFFKDDSLFDKIEFIKDNHPLIEKNFQFAKNHFGKNNIKSFLELY